MSEPDSKPPAMNLSPDKGEQEPNTTQKLGAPSIPRSSAEWVGNDEPNATATPTEPAILRKPSRLRRFFLRHLPISVAAGILLLAATLTGLYFFASSPAFENYIRGRIVREVETATGGRVEIASFHWNLLRLEAEAGGVVIHGREAPGEAPYAQAEKLRVRLSLLGFLSPHIRLNNLEILKPQFHLIVYPDGSTNQPQPRKPSKQGKPALDAFFNLKASHIAVEQGVLDYDNRAASFDFQDRFLPLDFVASDLSVRMSYAPTMAGNPEFYRVEAGVRDLSLARGAAASHHPATPTVGGPSLRRSSDARVGHPQVHGTLQATLDLSRTVATLRSLRITARGRGIKLAVFGQRKTHA